MQESVIQTVKHLTNMAAIMCHVSTAVSFDYSYNLLSFFHYVDIFL